MAEQRGFGRGARRCARVRDRLHHRRLSSMTMPAPEDDERDAEPLGSDVTQDEEGGTSGVVGPSYPPEETEPDAS